MYSDTVRT